MHCHRLQAGGRGKELLPAHWQEAGPTAPKLQSWIRILQKSAAPDFFPHGTAQLVQTPEENPLLFLHHSTKKNTSFSSCSHLQLSQATLAQQPPSALCCLWPTCHLLPVLLLLPSRSLPCLQQHLPSTFRTLTEPDLKQPLSAFTDSQLTAKKAVLKLSFLLPIPALCMYLQ